MDQSILLRPIMANKLYTPANYHELVICSKDRTSLTDTPENFTVNFNKAINMSSFFIKRVTMSQSWYTFLYGDYFFYQSNTVNTFIYMTPGTYNIQTMAPMLEAAFTAVGVGMSVTLVGQYTLQFVVTDGSIAESIVAFDPSSAWTLYVLGMISAGDIDKQSVSFTNPITVYFLQPAGIPTLLAFHAMNCNRYPAVYITFPNFQQYLLTYMSSTRPAFANGTLVAKIGVNWNYNYITYEPIQPLMFQVNNAQNIYQLNVSVTDDEGQPIDLNYVDWSFTIAYYS